MLAPKRSSDSNSRPLPSGTCPSGDTPWRMPWRALHPGSSTSSRALACPQASLPPPRACHGRCCGCWCCLYCRYCRSCCPHCCCWSRRVVGSCPAVWLRPEQTCVSFGIRVESGSVVRHRSQQNRRRRVEHNSANMILSAKIRFSLTNIHATWVG